MIKSAQWIKDHCLKPRFVTMTKQYSPIAFGASTTRHQLTHEDKITLEARKLLGVIQNYREVFPEDLANYKPMISPFIPIQVATQYEAMRAAYDYEYSVKEKLGRLHQDFDGDPEFNARKVIPYGLNGHSYGVRVSEDFKIFIGHYVAGYPENTDPKAMETVRFETPDKDGGMILPGRSFAIAKTVEHFIIPENVVLSIRNLWQYLICGIEVTMPSMPFKWEGPLRLRITNTSDHSVKIYQNEGIADISFLEVEN